MKVISIGTDRKIFEENSGVASRQKEYAAFFDELHIIVFSEKTLRLEKTKIRDNIFVYPTNSKNKFFYVIDAIKLGLRIIKANNFHKSNSVITAQDPFETGVVALLLKFKTKFALQIQIHTDFLNRYFVFHSPLNFIRVAFGFIPISFADSIRVVSNRIANSIHNLNKNIEIIPIQVDKVGNQINYQISGPVMLLTISRLEKEKDLVTAIKAVARALQNGANIKYTITGEGSEEKNLKSLVKELGVGDKITFIGWQNDLADLYSNSHIYLSTSLYEGYGMSIMQAASCGLALVISDAGVAGDILEDKKEALIFEPKDVETCSKYIIKLSTDTNSISFFGSSSKNKFDGIFISKEDYTEKYVNSIKNALDYSKENTGIFEKNVLLRYLVAGFSAAMINLLSLFAFTEVFKIYYIYSSILAFVIALFISFVLQKFWTFADKNTKGMHNQFGKYTLVTFGGLVINTAFMFVFVNILGIWYILAQILTNVFIAIFNFLMYKFVIFKKHA